MNTYLQQAYNALAEQEVVQNAQIVEIVGPGDGGQESPDLLYLEATCYTITSPRPGRYARKIAGVVGVKVSNQGEVTVSRPAQVRTSANLGTTW